MNLKMNTSQETLPHVPRFDRGAWLVFAFALLFMLADVGELVYRYTLPTEGWSVIYSQDPTIISWSYNANLVGVPSGLRIGDAILAVDGHTAQITGTLRPLTLPPDWAAGKTVMVTVQRGPETLTVPVRLTHWTLSAVWRMNTQNPVQVVNILGSLLILAVAWFTFLLRNNVPSARMLLMLGVFGSMPSISVILPDGLSMAFNPVAFFFFTFYAEATWAALLAPTVLAFTLTFPQPKQVIQRHLWLMGIPFGIGLAELVSVYTLDVNSLNFVGSVAPEILFVAAIISLIHSWFTQRDPTSRAQIRWVIGGFVVGLGLSLLSLITSYSPNDPVGILINVISSLGGVAIGAGLGIAVLRYHLFDIDVIIRKTLVYALLTGLLALIYYGGVVLVDTLTGALGGQQHSTLALVLSTLAIAALFNPLRHRIQTIIDQRFYRSKYNAEQALEGFQRYIRNEVDLGAMTQALQVIVQDALQPEFVALWLPSIRPDKPEAAEPTAYR